jgi:SAM-dependent methyltransferase
MQMVDILWAERNSFLSSQIALKIQEFSNRAKLGLDVGCSTGEIASNIKKITGVEFCGIEPFLSEKVIIKNGIEIRKAWAHGIPFDNDTFDVVVMTSVYEHIQPHERFLSIQEIYRVLKPGGIFISQIPNMNFPIEPHSHLPLQQFLPRKLGAWYFEHFERFSSVAWKNEDVNWYRVGTGALQKNATNAGFLVLEIKQFNYPKEATSPFWRRFYFVSSAIPIGYILSFEKPV